MADNPFLKYVAPDASSQDAPAPGGANPFMKYVQEQPAPKKPGIVEDVAKTASGALYKGSMDVVGAPADIMNMVDQGWQWLVSKGLEKAGVWTPEQAEKARQPLPGIEDRSTRMGLPTSKLLVDATEKAAGPFYTPQTTEGEVAGAAVRALPSMVLGQGTLAQRGAQALVPAMTAETAGQVTRRVAPEWETTARVVGGLGGAAVTAAAQVPRGASVVARNAVQGVHPLELEAAYGLMGEAARLPGGGVQLTLNDALNQVTGGRMTRLQQLDRVVTNSGGPGADRMTQRVDQVQRTGQAAVDSLAPAPYLPEQAAQRGQDAAEGALGTVRAERSDITRPFYQNAARDTVPAPEVQAVIQRLDDIIANSPTPELGEAARQLRGQLIETPAVPGTPATRTPVTDPRTRQIIRYQSTPAVPGTPEVPRTNVGELDQVYGQARDDFLGPPGLGETGSQVRARRAAGDAITPLNQALEAASPNLQQGRAAHRQVTNNLVRPVEQGPVGRIAEMDPSASNASAQMGRELAAPGVDRYHGVVQQSVRRMVREDPRAAETLARDYVGDVLNTATRDLQGGANVYGGANFFKKVAGDGASMRNLEAMVTQLPDGANRWAGFQRFLDVMQATGYKAPKGSDTAFNLGIKEQMGQPGLIAGAVEAGAGAAAGAAVGGGAGSAAGGAMGVRRALSDRLAQWRMANGGDQVAWMLTSREAAPLLRQLANAPAGSNSAIGLSLRLSYVAERALNHGQQSETAPVVEAR
jgi:hypothetical protein